MANQYRDKYLIDRNQVKHYDVPIYSSPNKNLRRSAVIPQNIINYVEKIKYNLKSPEAQHNTGANIKNKLKIFTPVLKGNKEEFVLDGHKINERTIPEYNGFKDKHLFPFFNKPSMIKHLNSMRIVLLS